MKHDHKKTSKLKVCLFTIVMLLPCFAVGITCLTHVFNKEVTEETETATINYMYQTNNPQQELIQNNVYLLNTTLSYADIIQNEDDQFIIEIIENTVTINNNTFDFEDTVIGSLHEIKQVKWQIQIDYEILSITMHIDKNTDQYIQYSPSSSITTLTFNNTLVKILPINNSRTSAIYTNLQEIPNNLNPIESVTITTNPQDQTTNIFYDSCEQVEDSFILNWCNNANPVRTPIEQFTNAFSLPSNHIINTLITYWLCIAMIYIVIDIIIECVIMITHFFNKEF